MSSLQLRLSKWLNRLKKRDSGPGIDDDDRPFGTSDDLLDIGAQLHEHGCFLMMRQVRTASGEEFFEDVTARFRTENCSPVIGLRLGEDLYLSRIDELEDALSDPARPSRGSDPVPPEDPPSREECQNIPGCLVMMRWAEEIEDQELFEPLPALFVATEEGRNELLIRDKRYVFRPGDLWDSLTDPRTYRRDDDGPFPIDALRDPGI
jgi:hypothetical protein